MAECLSEMTPFLGKEISLVRLVPIVHNLLKDENSEVKLRMCKGLNKMILTIGSDILSN